MYLHDLYRLLKHYIKTCLFVVVAFALVGCGVGVWQALSSPGVKTASASLTVVDPTGILSLTSLVNMTASMAGDVAAPYNVNAEIVEVESATDQQAVTFIASADTEKEAVDLVNSIANETAAMVEASLDEEAHLYEDSVRSYDFTLNEDGFGVFQSVSAADRIAAFHLCYISVTEATEAEGSALGGIVKVGLVAAVAGLFAAVFIVLIRDAIRKPIRGMADIDSTAECPTLSASASSDIDDVVWAEAVFGGSEPLSVCVVPVSGDIAEEADGLVEAARRAGFDAEVFGGDLAESAAIIQCSARDAVIPVFGCPPLAERVDAAYVARGCSATILYVREWSDSLPSARSAIEVLNRAGAKIVGVVVLPAR